MTKKDFELIADIMMEAIASDPDGWSISIGQAAQICGKVADRLRATNPRFDRARFLKACRV